MSTGSPNLEVKFCHFSAPFAGAQYYWCYTNEVCCPEGCCSATNYNLRYFRSWYFWLILLGIFVLYKFVQCSCKKIEQQNPQRHLLNSATNNDDTSSNILDHLIVTYTNRCLVPTTSSTEDTSSILTVGTMKTSTSDPPPDYSVAVNLPKPRKTSSNTGVPTYEEALAKKNYK